MRLHPCSKLASSVYLTVEARMIYAKMMMNSQMLPFYDKNGIKKGCGDKITAQKIMEVAVSKN